MTLDKLIKIYAEVNYLDEYKVFQDLLKGWIAADDLLDTWLRYEGIIGYTGKILDAIQAIEPYM